MRSLLLLLGELWLCGDDACAPFRHASLSAAQQQLIRETLMKWLQCQVATALLGPAKRELPLVTLVVALQLMNTQPEKVFIRNKAAQVFALTFVMEYLTLWPKFFFDVLLLVGLNPNGVDIYLRTLMAIDAEVVDRDVLHSPEVRRVRCEAERWLRGPASTCLWRGSSICWKRWRILFFSPTVPFRRPAGTC